MSPVHRIDDRSLLTSVINGDGIYLGPTAVFEGLALSGRRRRGEAHRR